MEKTLITISRQHGSGGTEVAQILADRLGVWYYNREILYIAADKIGFDSLDEQSMEELNYKKSSKYMEGLSVMMGTPGHIPVYNQMFKEQGKIIQKLAGYGSGVFLGRCADYILKDFENVYSVYLYANDEFRQRRLSEAEGREVSMAEIKKEDKTRESYYNYYTGQKWGDVKNYDLALNMGKISFEEAADLILSYIEKHN
ncbi:AAA family ATPase [Anaerostipes sp.]|uniref:cytidylate kinase-like family protein n=1 Tax=Anaerostipes sp. TaxID=1872530 RepID=UPI0025C5E50C|nr:cytidylate kinase-like family protein [Anaerostipes sp.]MBS7009708.1 cytidylate kinase-like family protein [Anaerostipes sp.]